MQREQGYPRSTAACDQTHPAGLLMNYDQGREFTYEPFTDDKTQLRLLQMLPGDDNFDEPLSFSTCTQTLEEATDFNAISYTWGDGE